MREINSTILKVLFIQHNSGILSSCQRFHITRCYPDDSLCIHCYPVLIHRICCSIRNICILYRSNAGKVICNCYFHLNLFVCPASIIITKITITPDQFCIDRYRRLPVIYHNQLCIPNLDVIYMISYFIICRKDQILINTIPQSVTYYTITVRCQFFTKCSPVIFPCFF